MFLKTYVTDHYKQDYDIFTDLIRRHTKWLEWLYTSKYPKLSVRILKRAQTVYEYERHRPAPPAFFAKKLT